MYLVYIIQSKNRSYIGMTNDFLKRWKQHNNILKVGQNIPQSTKVHGLHSVLWTVFKQNQKQCNVNGNLNGQKDTLTV